MEPRLQVANDLVRRYQPLLCSDWKVTVKLAPVDYPRNPASMQRHMFERKAVISLDPRIKAHEVRQCVLHELSHLVVGDYENMVTTLLDKVLSDAPTDVAFRELFNDSLERVCDTIANAFLGDPNGQA